MGGNRGKTQNWTSEVVLSSQKKEVKGGTGSSHWKHGHEWDKRIWKEALRKDVC